MSDVASTTEVGGIDLGNEGHVVHVSGHYAYIGQEAEADKNEFVIYDIGNPASTTELGGINTAASVYDITSQGRYVYLTQNGTGVAGTDPELRIIDISNPNSPSARGKDGSASAVGYAVAVSGKYAYLGNSTAASALRVYDISNSASPTLLTTVTYTGSNYVVDLSIAGKYLYALIENTSGTVTGDLLTYDISKPNSPVLMGAAQLGLAGSGDTTMGVFASGRYVYVAKANSGITNDFVVLILPASTRWPVPSTLDAGSRMSETTPISKED